MIQRATPAAGQSLMCWVTGQATQEGLLLGEKSTKNRTLPEADRVVLEPFAIDIRAVGKPASDFLSRAGNSEEQDVDEVLSENLQQGCSNIGGGLGPHQVERERFLRGSAGIVLLLADLAQRRAFRLVNGMLVGSSRACRGTILRTAGGSIAGGR